jgi:hypothetical protein
MTRQLCYRASQQFCSVPAKLPRRGRSIFCVCGWGLLSIPHKAGDVGEKPMQDDASLYSAKAVIYFDG